MRSFWHNNDGRISVEKGVIYTGRFNFLGVQLIGVLSVAVYGLAAMTLLFVILKHTVGIRVSEKAEIMVLTAQSMVGRAM